MSNKAGLSLTWKTVFRAALIWGAEDSVLCLIEDAAVWIKLATGVLSVLALLVLEFETRLRQLHKRLLYTLMILLIIIFMGVLILAGLHAEQRATIKTQLDNYYIESSHILLADRPQNNISNIPSDEEREKWEKEMYAWRDKTSVYIDATLGPTEKLRFEDTFSGQPVFYPHQGVRMDADVIYLVTLRKNLLDIRDSLEKPK